MLNKALSMFNQYYGTQAKVIEAGDGSYLFNLNSGWKEIQGMGEAVHFLMCRTTHYHFIQKDNLGSKVFNLAMLLVNRHTSDGEVYFNENAQGKITIWGLKCGKWFIITTYDDKAQLYSKLLNNSGVFSIINKVETHKTDGIMGAIKRLFEC